jgi:hypothetical protein
MPTFRWLVALKHVLIAWLLVVGIWGLAYQAGAFESFGVAMRALLLSIIAATILSLAASYGGQTGQRGLAMTASGLAVVFSVLPLVFYAWSGSGGPVRLTRQETASLRRANGFLCQPALGVRFADPGLSFEPDRSAEREAHEAIRELDAKAHFWVWTNPATGQGVILQAVKGPGTDTVGGFRDFVRGLRGTVERNTGVTIDEARTAVDELPYEHRIAFTRINGEAGDFRCLGRVDDAATLVVVCVGTDAADHEALRDVRESLAFQSCGPSPS